MKKAHLKNLRGFYLELPKYGNTLMLLMEKLAEISIDTYVGINVSNEDETFNVRLGLSEAQMIEIKDYINSNL